MEHTERWIWLPEDLYPQHQTTRYSERDHIHENTYAAVAFSRKYSFAKPIREVEIRCSGDTAFALFCNGRHLMNGPVLPGGDFLDGYHTVPLPSHYATVMSFTEESDCALREGILDLYAQVRMGPSRCFEYSMGHGGYMLSAIVRFADGSLTEVHTDNRWRATVLTAYTGPGRFDNSRPKSISVWAEEIPNRWNCQTAPIPHCTLEPLEVGTVFAVPGSVAVQSFELHMIFAGYIQVHAKTSGKLSVKLYCSELGGSVEPDRYIFTEDGEYLGLELRSVGHIRIEAENCGTQTAEVSVRLIRSSYPITETAITATSDPELDQVLKTCLHTLKYCRQSIHLDSPKHCEPLACTGDYYVETLMTAFSFGDMRLAAFDVRRTAELLRHRDGRMFHTSYSLIWVQMLWDVYLFTGEKNLLEDCADALTLLLERFHRYIGDNGLLETPPDYMFIDWLVPDGISLHHPPKALGQTCLCLYYYGALKTSAKIWEVLEDRKQAETCLQRMEMLHGAVLRVLYDPHRKLFFEGLNTPTDEALICEWMPRNVEKRYYRKHANILAAYFGFFSPEENAALLERMIKDDRLGQVQPWFCHFLLEAVYRCRLREKYTLKLLEQWKAPVKECPKGLPEGFHKPQEDYTFDHSHAWGGTPAYALPLALSGLEILEPGYRKIRLDPTLLGLEWADVEIPTPFGMIRMHMRKGASPEITVPDGIILV